MGYGEFPTPHFIVLLTRLDRLSEIIRQTAEVLIVFLADVLLKFSVRSPVDIPGNGPRLCVSARIVNCGFVMQRSLIRSSVFLDDVHLIRVGMTVVIEPRSLVEPNHIHDERFTFP